MEKLLTKGPLLDENGNLVEAGYAFSLVKEYTRSAIKAKPSRIKEWDYYYIGNEHYGVAFTISDNSYMGLSSVSFLDFDKKKEITKSRINFFTNGKTNLPSSSKEGDIFFNDKICEISFKHENGKRHIHALYKSFRNDEDFRADLYLEETNESSMVIATPFKKDKHFYYNQKINCLKSSGYVKIGENMFDFNKDCYGVLDWGRGVWTYTNTWYWSSLNSIYKGKRIGFNLGYGFGDTSAASENMFFYDDKAYKLENVIFDIPISKTGSDDFMSKWKIRSKNADIQMEFQPIINRHANLNALLIQSNQNQVFGYFSGSFIIDGQRIDFDNLLGFAEKVKNRW